MFVRIVKMEFQEGKITKFLSNFEKVKEKIRNSQGYRLLENRQKNND
jgi:heme-degrading monooxygenase HmoA